MLVLFEFILSFLIFLFALLFMVLSILIGLDSKYDLIVGPAVFPIVISTIVIIFSGFWILKQIIKNKGRMIKELKQIKTNFIKNKNFFINFLIIVLSSFCYILILMPLIGFTISTALFLFITTLYFGKMKLVKSIILSVLFSYSINYFFLHILNIYLP